MAWEMRSTFLRSKLCQLSLFCPKLLLIKDTLLGIEEGKSPAAGGNPTHNLPAVRHALYRYSTTTALGDKILHGSHHSIFCIKHF